jgi:hypothetical protein
MACRPIFNTNINDRRDEDEFMPPVSRNHSLAPKALFPRQSLAPRCALPRPSLAPSRTGGLPTQQKLSLLPKYSLKPRQPTPQTAGKATPTGGGGCSTTNTRNNISSTKTSSGASGSSNSLGRQTVASQNKASSVRRSPLTYATGPPPFGRPTSANKGTNSAEKKRFPYSGVC